MINPYEQYSKMFGFLGDSLQNGSLLNHPGFGGFTMKPDGTFSLKAAQDKSNIGMSMPPVPPGTIPGATVGQTPLLGQTPLSMGPPIPAGSTTSGGVTTVPQNQGFLKQLWTGLNDPSNAAAIVRMLATIGASTSAVEPNSWQHQLGIAMQSVAAGRQAEQLQKSLQPGGTSMTAAAKTGMTPEEQSAITKQVQDEQFRQQQVALEKEKIALQGRQTTAEEVRTKAQAELMGAQTAAEAPYGSLFQQQKDIEIIRGEYDLKKARIPSISYVHYFADGQTKIKDLSEYLGTTDYASRFTWDSLSKFQGDITKNGGVATEAMMKELVPLHKAPKLTDSQRGTLIQQLYNQIHSELPKEWHGLKGRIDIEDIEANLSKLPESIKPKARMLVALRNALDTDAQTDPSAMQVWDDIVTANRDVYKMVESTATLGGGAKPKLPGF